MIDMLELGVAIGMTTSFQGLAIGLKAITHLVEHFGDHAMARLVSHPLQLFCQTTNALTGPPQGRFWLSTLGGLYELLQIRPQRQIGIDRPFAASSRPPNSAALKMRFRRRLELLDAPVDCESGNSRRTRYHGDSSEPNRFSFRSGCQTPRPLIEMLIEKLEPPPNRLFIIHYLLRIQQIPSRRYTCFVTSPWDAFRRRCLSWVGRRPIGVAT